ncbi:MAG: RHS repeat-associated core domain-containing protein [Polyangiaceae bacterium]|nr:RHS repeat-associated core domain-containing protein [Polyangiaceae bacterium]MCW5789161.1 RHS repeat-associated core domain-containing protein [Polyangiaceae bacterium]
MARTAPVPNIPAPPGMNPGTFVAGGGGDGGGGSGKGGSGGSGNEDAGTEDGDEDASGDDNDGGEGCGDPVCPITGRVFVDVLDFAFNGPAPLRFMRGYSSRTSNVAGELGYGWNHELGWTLEEKRRRVVVTDDRARKQRFKRDGNPTKNALGWTLSQVGERYELRIATSRLTYHFSPIRRAPGRFALTAVVDRYGNTTQVQRGEHGELLGFIDSAGRPYRTRTDAARRLLEIEVATEPTHQRWMRLVSYRYDESGNLTQVTDAEGHSFTYGYQGHLLVEQRTPTGLSYCYRYDGGTHKARCLETWGEYIGRTDPALMHPPPPRPIDQKDNRPVKGIQSVRFEYLPEQHYAEAENGRGAVTRYFGDALGRVVRKVMPNGGVYESSYAPNGALDTTSDPDGHVTKHRSDSERTPVGFTGPNGEGLVVQREPDGTFIEVDERSGRVTRRRYDSNDNLTFVGHADGTWEEYEHDSRGLITAIVDRTGSVTRRRYDAMANLVETALPEGEVETSEYDYLGRRLAFTSPSGARTEWRWNRLNEVVWKRAPDGMETHVVYNPLMKPLEVREGNSVWRYEYGGLDWVTQITNPRGDVTELRYDVEGNLTWVKNARGQVYRQEFDLEDQPISAETFEGIKMSSRYDVMGRVEWTETPDGVTTLSYNDLGQLAKVEFADGEVVSLEHLTGAGLTRVDNQSVLVETWYDGVGQPVREIQGDHEIHVGWRGGQVATISPSSGPALVTGEHSAFSGTLQVGSKTLHLGRRVGQDRVSLLGTDLVYRVSYHENGRIRSHSIARRDAHRPLDDAGLDSDPNRVWWERYDYAGGQRLTSVLDSRGTHTQFEHDALGQVTSRVIDRGGLVETERVAYDAAGSPTLEGVVYDHLRRPIGVDGEVWEYDQEGRLQARNTQEGRFTYHFSTSSSLMEVRGPDQRVALEYDGRGRLMRKRVYRSDELVKSIDYIWANQMVIQEVDRLAGTTRTYLRLNREWEVLGHVDSGPNGEQAYLYARDSSGAVIAAFAEDGRQVFAAERSIFGDYTTTIDEVGITARLVNQFADPDVGLYYNRFRWYDPRVGMYISRDPLELDGTWNPRDYVRDPYRYIDPLGLAMTMSSNNPQDGHGHPDRPDRPGPSLLADNDEVSRYLTQPGYNATNGTEAVPGYVVADAQERTGRGFRSSTTTTIDAAGDAYGCHSCGRKRKEIEKQDGKFGHWRKDHQPPLSHVDAADEHNGHSNGVVRIYPHCPRCSSTQGGLLSSRRPTDADAARAAAIMAPRAADESRRGPPRRGT